MSGNFELRWRLGGRVWAMLHQIGKSLTFNQVISIFLVTLGMWFRGDTIATISALPELEGTGRQERGIPSNLHLFKMPLKFSFWMLEIHSVLLPSEWQPFITIPFSSWKCEIRQSFSAYIFFTFEYESSPLIVRRQVCHIQMPKGNHSHLKFCSTRFDAFRCVNAHPLG